MRSLTLQIVGGAAAVAIMVLVANGERSAGAAPVYRTGHADIGVDYLTEPARFELHIRFGSDVGTEDGTNIAIQTLPSAAVAIRAPDPPILREATAEVDFTGPEWDFLGVAIEEPLWFTPQTQEPDKPFLGFATDSLSPSQWSGPLTWSLEAIVSRPAGGEFSLWQTDFFGNPQVKFASSDGIDEGDEFVQAIGGHDHYNWGFSQPGIYEVELGATANRVGVGLVHGSGIFTFLVGDDAGEVLEGDYNGDGTVDAADYVVWRDTLGQIGEGLIADGDGNGEVDGADYDVWKANFGRMSLFPVDNVGSAAASVPEPATLYSFLGLSFVVGFCGRNHVRR